MYRGRSSQRLQDGIQHIMPVEEVDISTSCDATSCMVSSYCRDINKGTNVLLLTLVIGPIVRLGPNFVSFNTATAVQTIYGNSRKNNVRKADMYNFFDDAGQSPSTFNTLEKGPQSRKRRILSHAFSPQALEGADEVIVRNTDRWCDILGQSDSSTRHDWTEARDMTQYCDWFAFDTAVDLAFGKTFNLLGDEKYRFLPSYIMSCLRLLTFVSEAVPPSPSVQN